jgi:protein O-mannosyl-transferase
MSMLTRSSHKNAGYGLSAGSFSSSALDAVTVGAVIIGVAVLICYIPSMNGGFVLDDDNLMTQNPLMDSSGGFCQFWCTYKAQEFYPVSNSTFWLEWHLWRLVPAGYHVTNLILHIVDALLIWVILRRLSVPGGLIAAIVFAVHPVNVESVAWIAQVRNMLAMTFFLLSILFYLEVIRRSADDGQRVRGAGRWYWLSLGAFVLAMLGKGSAAVLPGIILGIVWWLRRLTLRGAARMIPFFVMSGALTAVCVWFQTRGDDIVFRHAGFGERLAGAGLVPWFYLYEAIFPVDLYFVYPMWHIRPDSILWWAPLAAASAVTAVLWWRRNGWGRPLLFAWGFFCVALLPVAGFADTGFMRYSLVADHYQHMAIIGVIALAAAGVGEWRVRSAGRMGWVPAGAALAAVGCLALLTWRQNGIYTDEVTLYRAALRKNPDCSMVHNNLGFLLATLPPPNTDMDEAISHFREAVSLNPEYAEAHNNLGAMLLRKNELNDAEEHLRESVRLKPGYADAYRTLGDILIKAGRFRESSECYEEALRLKPDFAEACSALAQAYASLQRPYEAINAADKALKMARSQGHTEMAARLEEWLRLYRASLSGRGGAAPQ